MFHQGLPDLHTPSSLWNDPDTNPENYKTPWHLLHNNGIRSIISVPRRIYGGTQPTYTRPDEQ